jgi:hypothetical protein
VADQPFDAGPPSGPEVPDELPDDLLAIGLLLAQIDPARADDLDAEPPPGLADRVVAAVAAARTADARGGAAVADGWVEGPPVARRAVPGSARARAATRWWAAGGVLAAAAAVVVGLLVVSGSDTDDQEQFAFTLAPAGVEASYSLTEKPWGTEIELDVAGMPDGRYWLWLTDESGVRSSAGTFRGGDDGTLRFTTGLPTDAAVRIWVTDALDDGDVVLDADVPA